MSGAPNRDEPVFPNTAHVARREYGELTRSRLFHVSTVILMVLAVFIAVMPIVARLAERGSASKVAVVSPERELAKLTIAIMTPMVATPAGGGSRVEFEERPDAGAALRAVDERELDAVILVDRGPTGGLAFSFRVGETMGQGSLQTLTVATFGVALLDFSARNPVSGFVQPTTQILQAAGSGQAAPFQPSNFASRLIVGAVFGFLIFLTIVIYGMWVAQGVVAEKSSRVMELLISAASARQLVLGKTLGIGAAGATQVLFVLAPALLTLAVEDRLATMLLGPGGTISLSLQALSPGLLLGFAAFYVLGFALYALIYAAAGSLVSRPEDLQIIALPLSLIAIVGYFQSILALSGGISWFIRLASFVPFWSPFVMLTRLSVGRVEPAELIVSLALLALTILATAVIAIRIYSAGVVLYGQRPGLRAYVEAARRG